MFPPKRRLSLCSNNIKQLLDEFEQDIMNYQNRRLRQITQTRGFDNS